MQYFGDVNDTLSRIVDSFENGNIPAAMAQTFVTGAAERHCATYSFMNRIIVMLNGYSDAMGYGQWKKIDRHVKKGEKGFAILAPIIKGGSKRKVNPATGVVEEKDSGYCIGFKAVKVFGLEQTDGKPIENGEQAQKFLDSLPLMEVAEAWGIKVEAYNGESRRAYGMYFPVAQKIALGTQNLSTWAHELAHAADDRLGNLEGDKRWVSEVAAELAGAVLLESIGKPESSDRGGCWEYISKYATNAGVQPIDACRMVIGRVGKIVELILEASKPHEEMAA